MSCVEWYGLHENSKNNYEKNKEFYERIQRLLKHAPA
jgi:hypothetical protein